LFASNYFDQRYEGLFETTALERLDPTSVTRLSRGVVVDVADPYEWETAADAYARVLSALGPELFFDRQRPDQRGLAPAFRA
jgi:hypothetical protein